MNYLFHLCIYGSVYAILALSLNLIVGSCGLLTLAHGAFFGIGAYCYALLTLNYGIGVVPALAGGAVLGMLLSLALSLPAWRLKGDNFVMISIAVQTLFYSILRNWWDESSPIGTWENLTNGLFGLSGIPKPSILGITVSSLVGQALLAVTITGLCGGAVFVLTQSPWGRLLRSMREDELALRSLGKNTRIAKAQALAISSGLACVAGGIYAGYAGYIEPANASLDFSILVLCMVLVGGAGNCRGPLVGASVLLLIPELLKFANLPEATAAQLRLLGLGLLLILISHLRPQGLAGEYQMR